MSESTVYNGSVGRQSHAEDVGRVAVPSSFVIVASVGVAVSLTVLAVAVAAIVTMRQ